MPRRMPPEIQLMGSRAAAAARHRALLERIEDNIKWCPRCQRWLELDAFGAPPSHAHIADGRNAYCRACDAAATQRWRERDRPRQADAAAATETFTVARTACQRPRLVLPRAPDWSRGLCTTSVNHAFWTSEEYGERKAAAEACLSCPILTACSDWALSISSFYTTGVVYAGLLPVQLREARKALIAGVAAAVAG